MDQEGSSRSAEPWVVYIDGLNFHSAVRGRPGAKWVDLRELSSRLIPGQGRLDRVKYFTAQISAKAAEDPASPGRQRLFIRAAKATPDVEVYEGKFQVPEAWRSISSKGQWDDDSDRPYRGESSNPIAIISSLINSGRGRHESNCRRRSSQMWPSHLTSCATTTAAIAHMPSS